MKLLTLLAQRARGQLIAAVGCGVVGGASNTVFLAMINHRLGEAGAASSSAALALGFAATAVMMLVTYLISRVLLLRLLQHKIHDLRLGLCRQILAAPLLQIETLGAARVQTMLVDDVVAIAGSLGVVPTISINAVIVVGGLLYLGTLSLPLAALLVAMLAAAVVSYSSLDRRATAALTQAREALDQLGEDLEGIVHGNRELKLNAERREVFLSRQLAPHLALARQRSIQGGTQFALAVSWGQVLTVMLIGLVLFVVPVVFALPPNVLRGYALAVLQISGAIGVLLEAIPGVRQAQISWAKIERLRFDLGVDLAPVAPVAPAALGTSETASPEVGLDPMPRAAPRRPFAQLELREVTYAVSRDRDSPFTLGPISLTFRPGELVFLTGGNGSGKTTLAKVLVGLYPPSSGRLCLDGEVITPELREAYRQLFSVAFTDGHAFRSLLGLDEARVQENLARFELAPWVHVAAGALSTTALSQGQRKRVLLATALAEDRPFYVFDEWAANQDPPFRHRFYREILPELRDRGKAVVVITHDDRYEELADRVIKLDRGELRSAAPPLRQEEVA
jgi:putative pyoverdin transport system ATP-binding/permease protein